MAKQRFLQLVREGVVDERLWHWTPELAKDPNMREVYVEKGKKPQAVLASEVDEDQAITLYSARATSFGEYDILKITPAEGEDEDAIEEVVDHITGKEAALARVEELNYPEGRSNIPAPPGPPAPRQEALPWLILVILTAVGGGLGAVKHVRDVYYGHKA